MIAVHVCTFFPRSCCFTVKVASTKVKTCRSPFKGATSVMAYFPSDTWYNYQNGSQLVQTGKWITLPAPLDTINIHQRGGSIVPTQRPAVTTTAARQLPFSLQVALDSQGQATGSLYWDDGDTISKLFFLLHLLSIFKTFLLKRILLKKMLLFFHINFVLCFTYRCHREWEVHWAPFHCKTGETNYFICPPDEKENIVGDTLTPKVYVFVFAILTFGFFLHTKHY